jgi:hypothetical protein
MIDLRKFQSGFAACSGGEHVFAQRPPAPDRTHARFGGARPYDRHGVEFEIDAGVAPRDEFAAGRVKARLLGRIAQARPGDPDKRPEPAHQHGAVVGTGAFPGSRDLWASAKGARGRRVLKTIADAHALGLGALRAPPTPKPIFGFGETS